MTENLQKSHLRYSDYVSIYFKLHSIKMMKFCFSFFTSHNNINWILKWFMFTWTKAVTTWFFENLQFVLLHIHRSTLIQPKRVLLITFPKDTNNF